jgi:hypothetical protein
MSEVAGLLYTARRVQCGNRERGRIPFSFPGRDGNPADAHFNRCNQPVGVVISGATIEAGLPDDVHLGPPIGFTHHDVLLEEF